MRDVQVQLDARNLSSSDSVALILDLLAGKTRQEILGRKEELKTPAQIFNALNQTVGDGNTLPQLLQKFFSWGQTSEDFVTCFLALVELFDWIVGLDDSFRERRQVLLKDRLAEAVSDEGLKRELRRLNIEKVELSFFDLRDRAVKWPGNTQSKSTNVKKPIAEEVTSSTDLSKLKNEIVQDVMRALKDSRLLNPTPPMNKTTMEP